MANRSTFISPDYTVDTFIEHLDISNSDLTNVNRYKELKLKVRTPAEDTELNNLTNLLRDKIFSPEDFNKLQDCIKNMENFMKNEVDNYVLTKQIEFQAEIDKFTYAGVYSSSTQYYKKNYITYNDGTGNNIYICIQNSIGNTPSNTSYFTKLGIKGEQGESGVGLVFKGAWSNVSTYDQNDAVQYNGVIFGALQTNTNQQPDITQDTVYWAKAWDIAVTLSQLIGTRNIVISTSSVNFITGEITAFNSNTDTLEVYLNTTRLTKGEHYIINANNQQIDKIGGTWDGTAEQPIFFEFVVRRNMLNNLVFSDGQSIAENTISKNKLTTDVQTTLDQVAINQNELDAHLADIATETDGAHGLRVNNGVLEYYNGTGWVEVGSGTDWRKYTPFSENLDGNAFVNTIIDTYETAFQVTGKGFVSKALAIPLSNSTIGVKMTIDDVVVYITEGTVSTTAYPLGLILDDALIGSTTASAITYGATTMNVSGLFADYPKTNPAALNTCLISMPVFFNSSFKVEIKTADLAKTHTIAIAGGIE